MRFKLCFCALMLASLAYAKDPKTYQAGKVLQMDSVNCGEKVSSSVSAEALAPDAGHTKTQELLCQEYLMQSENIVYRIRPRKEKHPLLLPVGEYAHFRLEKDKLLLRIDALDSKEHEYTVISMTPRSDSRTADLSTTHINHLQ